MKKIFLILPALAAFFIMTADTFPQSYYQMPAATDHSAENLKTITLTDGTILKGKLLSFQNGIYTVETTRLGQVRIKDADIASIASGSTAPSAAAISSPQNPGQIQTIQSQLLSDPEIIQDLQTIAQDPQMIELFSDKDFMSAVLSNDPEKIKQHPNSQVMMQNSKFQELLQKIQNKFDAPPPSP